MVQVVSHRRKQEDKTQSEMTVVGFISQYIIRIVSIFGSNNVCFYYNTKLKLNEQPGYG